ncbi:hypothetical protein CDL15_Pgr009696 [Punica granatum]|uniref:Uncharacterized protein n=1 Tax=Punica granatum TaxID=22663 RepID=A0A218WUZ7_PUNGR|nr:hypothetical protein CDL15_Pgr009696 [Punica granatum]PKI53954.1 hypothetical protein CRG98_025656 [Punica granatum]
MNSTHIPIATGSWLWLQNQAPKPSRAHEPHGEFALGSQTKPEGREPSISTNPSSRAWVHRDKKLGFVEISSSCGGSFDGAVGSWSMIVRRQVPRFVETSDLRAVDSCRGSSRPLACEP